MKLKRIYYTTRVSMMTLGMSVAAWSAVPLTIDNPGFEGPSLADGATAVAVGGGNPIAGTSWIPFFSDPPGSDEAIGYTGGGGIINPDPAYGFGGAAFSGDNFAYCYSYTYNYGSYTYNYDNGIRQVLTDVLADGVYTLSVQVGNPAAKNGVEVPNYRVSLYTENEVLLATTTGAVPAGDSWTQIDLVYDYGAAPQPGELGVPLEIRLYAADSGLSGPEVAYDDVSLTFAPTNPIADPGGPYLVGAGGDLELDGTGSLASDGETLTDPTSYEWDLDDDGITDVTGATPAAISEATLMAAPYNWVKGVDYPVKLTVTDSGTNVAETSTTAKLVPDLLIYEPFDYAAGSLNGQSSAAPDWGLTGTWGAGSNVADTSLTYGALAYQGGRVVVNPGGGGAQQNGISPGTTLTGAGLLDDGATLWFSALIVNIISPDADEKTYVALGTGNADGFDRIGGDGGSGFTVAVSKDGVGRVGAQLWNDGSDGSGGALRGTPNVIPDGETFLAVGKITWGEFGVANDTFELYLPDEDLNLGSPVSTISGDFDQLGTANVANAFDTISITGHQKNSGVPEVDELRFGGTYASVTPVDMVAPLLVSTDPVDDNPNGNGIQQVATFDESVFVGTGDIRIVNDTDGITTTIPVGDPQIVVSGNTLTITPSAPLISGKAYHIEIDAGAVTDYAQNDYAGISNATDWNFGVDGTGPILVSITDDTSPLPILTNSSLIYTVTFDEAIDAGTVDVSDFGNGGSAPITVDSVSATGDPAVFVVTVSTGGTSGDLTLEIVQGAVITDVSGNALDSSVAIPDDTTIPVNDPTPTAASLLTEFQATIASEQHPTYPNEARYFHVSVNPNNAGTGSYCATLVGTNDPAPRFVRNFTGPVEAYWFGGGANSVLNAGMTGGNTGILSFSTEDTSFDGFGQQQAKVWDATDPGADLATGGPGTGASDLPYIASADKNSGLWRSLGGATGVVDISSLASGSLHIYYGSFNATPSVRVTMKDNDNVAADLVIVDAHLNGDGANRSEYYLAEVDFVTDGFYDEIEFEWLANGSDYSGNGRGFGLVVTGPDVAADPFAAWSELDGATGVTFEGDANGDGVQDGLAFLLGAANPNVDASAAGLLPTVIEDGSGGLQLNFNCLPIADRGTAKLYVQHSNDLGTWTPNPTGVEVPDASGGPTSNVSFTVTPGAPLNGVSATIDSGAAAGGKLFGRLQATE
ncbi:MAG: Ig-like domain-containing protein [Haloferula sp.]